MTIRLNESCELLESTKMKDTQWNGDRSKVIKLEFIIQVFLH